MNSEPVGLPGAEKQAGVLISATELFLFFLLHPECRFLSQGFQLF